MCVFMLSSRLSLWSHSLHLKSFSLLCTHLMCLISFSLFARNFPHSPHSTPIASFSSSDNLQILSWLFINETLKFNPQLEHGWCLFSPCTYFVWTFSCPLDVSHLEQMLQINLIFFLWRLRFSDPPASVGFDVPIQSVFVSLFFVAQIANKRRSNSNEDWVKYYQAFTCWKRKQKFYTTSAAA